MKTPTEHIEHLRSKPHHVRRRIAFTAAFSGAAMIAVVWFVGTTSAGIFALRGSTFADTQGRDTLETGGSDSGNQTYVAGAAAAPAVQDTNAPARIIIVDDRTATSSGNKQTEATVLPF